MKELLLMLCLLTACDSPTSQGGTAPDVRGGWNYRATQTTPALQLDGELQITEQNGNTFSGTAAFTEIDVQGTQISRQGVLSGRFVGSSVVDMDIYIETQVRRHVASFVADSMNGTWSTSGAVSGSFSARRIP